MKKILPILLAIIFVIAAASPVFGENADLIRNGGFEDHDGADNFPSFWSFHSYEEEYKENYGNSSAFCEFDDDRSSTVLYISANSDDDAAVFQKIAVEPLSIYRLSCYIKTKNVENGAGANIALREIIATSDGLYGTNDWTLVELVGKTGPEQTYLVVSCRIGGYSAISHGQAWFDDFTIEKLDSWEGDVMPFYSGEVSDDDAGDENGNVLPIVLVCAAALLIAAAAIWFIVRKNKNSVKTGEPLPSVSSYTNDKARKLSPMQELKGRSFFDTRSDVMPHPTDLKLHFTKKDRIYIIALTVVYGFIALFRLGTLSFPTNAWNGYAGDTVRIDFGGTYTISEVWQNSGISYTNYVLRTDNGEEIAFSSKNRTEYGHMFRWAKLDNDPTATTGVTLEVLGGDTGRPNDPDLIMNELVFFDENGEIINCTVDESAAALFDEQKTVPKYPNYFNGMYFDELYHGRTALEHINNMSVYEWTHPPLGKLIIALGILIFGMKPFGWRVMGTLFGIFMVPIMYCFGKRLLKRSELALFSTFLFTFDFMHFTQTRIATVDVYGVFFILLMTYFMYEFISMDIGDSVKSMMKPLALSGIFFGLGCASKWICLYTGAGLALMFFVKLVIMGRKSYRLSRLAKYKDRKLVKKYWSNVLTLCCWCVIFFIVVPAVIYCASYCRYYSAQWKPARQAQIYAANTEEYASSSEVKLGFTDSVNTYISGVIKNQQDMYNYHSQLKSDHSAASPWWMWLANLRPTWFYVGGHDNPHGYVGTISTFGNPAVWLFCNIATLILIVVLIFHRRKFPLEPYFLFVCIASSLLPWVFVTRSTYAYHFFATVPYITLATGYLIGYWEDVDALKKAEKKQSPGIVPKIKYIWMVIAGLMFILFYPVISGMEVPYEYIAILQWVPFHKWEIRDADGNVIRTLRMGWRFLDYEPRQITDGQLTIIQK